MLPAYNKRDFIQACQKQAVRVWQPALESAAEDFGLRSEKELLEFIGHDGMEDFTLDNSRSFENWRGKLPAPMVDSYCFSSGTKKGYCAFYQGLGDWILKSFKRDMRLADLDMPLAGLAALLARAKKPEEKK